MQKRLLNNCEACHAALKIESQNDRSTVYEATLCEAHHERRERWEINNCPFCGGHGEPVHDERGNSFAHCTTCGACYPEHTPTKPGTYGAPVVTA